MRIMPALLSAGLGSTAGAALVAAAPMAASDPPAAQSEQGHQSHRQPHPGPGRRWHSDHRPDGGDTHGSHGDGGTGTGDAHQRHGTGPEITFRGCAFFENEGFAGRRGEIRDGVSVEWLGRDWNDRISSIACHPGCRLIGYVDINYGGARRNFTDSLAGLGPDWSDRISAIRSVCDGGSPQAQH